MGHTALGSVDAGAAEFLLADLFARDTLDDRRTGEEHIGGILDHQGEIRQGRGIDSSAGAGAEDAADLRDDARGEDVPLENLTEAGKGIDAFLDARTAGIIQADAGCSVADGHVHDLADLFGHGFGKGTATDGEILGEDIDETAADGAATGHHAVTVDVLLLHAEVGAAVMHEHVEFFEAAFVKEKGDALTGGELAFLVLRVDAFLTAAEFRFGPALDQFLDIFLLYGHRILRYDYRLNELCKDTQKRKDYQE